MRSSFAIVVAILLLGATPPPTPEPAPSLVPSAVEYSPPSGYVCVTAGVIRCEQPPQFPPSPLPIPEPSSTPCPKGYTDGGMSIGVGGDGWSRDCLSPQDMRRVHRCDTVEARYDYLASLDQSITDYLASDIETYGEMEHYEAKQDQIHAQMRSLYAENLACGGDR